MTAPSSECSNLHSVTTGSAFCSRCGSRVGTIDYLMTASTAPATRPSWPYEAPPAYHPIDALIDPSSDGSTERPSYSIPRKSRTKAFLRSFVRHH